MWLVDGSQTAVMYYCPCIYQGTSPLRRQISAKGCLGTLSFPQELHMLPDLVTILRLETLNYLVLGFFPVDGRIGKFFSSSAMVSLLLANELIFLSQNLKRKEIYY